MKKYISLIIFFVTVFVINAQSLGNSDCVTNPPNFGILSYDEASTAVDSEDDLIVWRKIKQICPEYIENLTSEIRQKQLNADNKVLAIYLLGELRPSDTNSIETLIENIDFRATRFDRVLKTRISIKRWGTYPAEEALVKIGQPVVIPILNHLPNETNQLRRQLMCNVLKEVWHRK